MTTTVEPKYWRVAHNVRGPLVDKTPVSEIMVSLDDYRAAVRQQTQCAGLTAAEWRKLWIVTVDQANDARSERDKAQFENQMLKVAIEALKRQVADLNGVPPEAAPADVVDQFLDHAEKHGLKGEAEIQREVRDASQSDGGVEHG